MSRCCALLFYCICFSIIKACKYWTSDTLDSLSEHGNIFYAQSLNKECSSINDLPASVQIYYDVDIGVHFSLQKQGKLCCTSEASKFELQKISTGNNTKGNTGFLVWLSTSCICCILHHKCQITDFYLVELNDNGDFDIVKK